MRRTATALVAVLLLGGCAIPGVGDFVDTGYGRAVQAIEADVKRIEKVHDDGLRIGERLVCGGSGPAPLRAYSAEQVRAWGCYCAAVMPDVFALACPLDGQTRTPLSARMSMPVLREPLPIAWPKLRPEG